MKLDELRACVLPGTGVVARFPSVVLVIPSGAWTDPIVQQLVAACRERAGEPIGSRVGSMLADPVAGPALPAFCAVAGEEEGLDVVLHGDVGAVVTGAGPVLRLSCVEPVGWSGRVRDRVASLTIGPTTVDGSATVAGPAGLELWEGVVAGSGVVLVPAGIELAAAAAPTAVATPTLVAPVAVAPPAPAMPVPAPEVNPTNGAHAVPVAPDLAAGVVSSPFSAETAVAAAPVQVALAMPGYAPAPAPDEDEDDNLIWGVHCKRGHFNNPDARYCRMCGAHMAQGRMPVRGPRPVLGYIVLDDGMTFEMDMDYILGSQPEAHPAVHAGKARGLTLVGDKSILSPAHTAVRLEGWEAVVGDCDSVTGTHLWAPGDAGWERLGTGQARSLRPGMHVLLGGRSFVFRPVNKR